LTLGTTVLLEPDLSVHYQNPTTRSEFLEDSPGYLWGSRQNIRTILPEGFPLQVDEDLQHFPLRPGSSGAYSTEHLVVHVLQHGRRIGRPFLAPTELPNHRAKKT
jgi:hypothetical protein